MITDKQKPVAWGKEGGDTETEPKLKFWPPDMLGLVCQCLTMVEANGFLPRHEVPRGITCLISGYSKMSRDFRKRECSAARRPMLVPGIFITQLVQTWNRGQVPGSKRPGPVTGVKPPIHHHRPICNISKPVGPGPAMPRADRDQNIPRERIRTRTDGGKRLKKLQIVWWLNLKRPSNRSKRTTRRHCAKELTVRLGEPARREISSPVLHQTKRFRFSFWSLGLEERDPPRFQSNDRNTPAANGGNGREPF